MNIYIQSVGRVWDSAWVLARACAARFTGRLGYSIANGRLPGNKGGGGAETRIKPPLLALMALSVLLLACDPDKEEEKKPAPSPTVDSAAYDASTHDLTLTGKLLPTEGNLDLAKVHIGLKGQEVALKGKADIKGQPSTTLHIYTIKDAAIRAVFALNGPKNKANVAYSLKLDAGWASRGAAKETTAITVGKGAPSIDSVSYNVGDGQLTITGGNLPPKGADLSQLSFDVTGAAPSSPPKYVFKSNTANDQTALAYTSTRTWTVTLSGMEKLLAEFALHTAANRFLVAKANWDGSGFGAAFHSKKVTVNGTPFGPLPSSGTLTVSTPSSDMVSVSYRIPILTSGPLSGLYNAISTTNLPGYAKVFIIGQGLSAWTELVRTARVNTPNSLVKTHESGRSHILATRNLGNRGAPQAVPMMSGAQAIKNGPALVALIIGKRAVSISSAYTLKGTSLTVTRSDYTMAVIQIQVNNQS